MSSFGWAIAVNGSAKKRNGSRYFINHWWGLTDILTAVGGLIYLTTDAIQSGARAL